MLLINPTGAWGAITNVMKNFLTYSSAKAQLKYLGNTLVRTAPLLMCSLSVLFVYKVGLFNIGAAGQYVAGACACLYAALYLHWHWLPCMLLAIAAGALLGVNWIVLYLTNMLLTNVKEATSPYTYQLKAEGPQAILPQISLSKLLSGNQYVTIAIPIAIVCAVVIWVVLSKTLFGYELKATGNNPNAAKYCGMAEKRNIILTLAIGGALAGLGASLLYQTGYEQWQCTYSSVPSMGFNGIAAAFLGGLSPIGSIFASFFIQHITAGGAYVDKSLYCSQISDLISAIIIYLCSFVLFFKTVLSSWIARHEEKKARKAAQAAGKGGEQA